MFAKLVLDSNSKSIPTFDVQNNYIQIIREMKFRMSICMFILRSAYLDMHTCNTC